MFIAFRSNNSDDPYLKLKTLTQVIRLVQDGYFEEIDMTKALEGAVRGFLEEGRVLASFRMVVLDRHAALNHVRRNFPYRHVPELQELVLVGCRKERCGHSQLINDAPQ